MLVQLSLIRLVEKEEPFLEKNLLPVPAPARGQDIRQI